MEAANENEILSFITLAASTANVIRYLVIPENEHRDCNRDAQSSAADKQAAEDERERIVNRLRYLASLERLLGKKN